MWQSLGHGRHFQPSPRVHRTSSRVCPIQSRGHGPGPEPPVTQLTCGSEQRESDTLSAHSTAPREPALRLAIHRRCAKLRSRCQPTTLPRVGSSKALETQMLRACRPTSFRAVLNKMCLQLQGELYLELEPSRI